MKYYIKYYKPLTILGFALILLFSCSGGDDTEPYIPPVAEKIIPSNISLEITMVGADVNNPNGDGSGTINCIATATDAVKYEFRFDIGAEVESTTGIVSHTYTQKETNTYTVYVYAYSKTGDYISASKEITVFVASKLFFLMSLISMEVLMIQNGLTILAQVVGEMEKSNTTLKEVKM